MKISPPPSLTIDQILPAKPTLLMGAGPVPIPKEVARANSLVISHLGETMRTLVSRIRHMGQYVFQTESERILGIGGPSSAAMEMATTALLWPGRKVLVLNNGTFSARFADLAKGVGADVVELVTENFAPFTAAQVEAALAKEKFDVLTIVQGETSCGMKNIHLEAIARVANAHGVLTIVDAVCTLSTMPLPMDEWKLDVVLTGGQKGLSAIPGISLIAFSERAFAVAEARSARMPHWCLDPRRGWRFWGLNEYHYTAPVASILALHEALRLICEETLEKRYERHEFSSRTLQHCLEVLGLQLFAKKENILNSVVAIQNPQGVNTKELIAHMVAHFQVEIAGAFGLDIVRVGQMGEQCRPENVRRTLEAIGESYNAFGVKLNTKAALLEFDRITVAKTTLRQEALFP